MTIKFDGHLLTFPGVTRTIVLPIDEELEGAMASAVVADALAAFSPLLRPLTIDVLLHAYHRETREPVNIAHPHWFATTLPIDVLRGIGPSTEGAIIHQVSNLTPDTVDSLIQEARSQEMIDPDTMCTWKEIRVYAVEVRLPEALADREVLSLEMRGRDVEVKVERRSDGSWINSTQCPGDEPPIKLTMTGGLPKLKIITHWSLWESGGVGEPDLESVINALLTRGWTRGRTA